MIFRRTVFLLVVALVVSGCAMTSLQKEQVAQFGKATEAMGEFAEKEFPTVRSEIVEMNTWGLILEVNNNDPKINLDRPISPESAAKRLAAAKALGSYGSLLNELATADRTEPIKKKAQDLVDTFDAALDQGLSDEQRGVATVLITSLGKMFMEKKKKDAVKAISAAYAEPVKYLADLLSVDFAAAGDGFLGGYTAVAGQLENRAIGILTGGQYPALADRERAVNALISARYAKKRAALVEMTAQKAIADLKEAQDGVVEVMKQDKYRSEDIKAFAKSIQQLLNMAAVQAKN